MESDDDRVLREQLGDYVREQRARTGLTVVRAARTAGIGRSTWTTIEHGKSPIPKPDTLGKIARALDISYDAITGVAYQTKHKTQLPPIAGDVTDVTGQLRELGSAVAELIGEVRHLAVLVEDRLPAPSDRAASEAALAPTRFRRTHT
jgi:transcriptional regulator with XRE-family HTH domain